MTVLIKTLNEIRDLLKKSTRPIGFVPTMGALHDGHISLLKASREKCKTTVVSIFVNPLQFSPNEDYNQYPRDLSRDLEICSLNNIEIVFSPSQEEIYPDRDNIKNNFIIPPPELTSILCGKSRVGHFNGVATVVKRLFEIIEPDTSFWGQKDLQQYYIVKWLINEYNFKIEAELLPTIREATGLAYSSRNNYLSKSERTIASALYKALKLAKENTKSGIFSISKAILESLIFLSHFPEIKAEYFEARGKDNLRKVDDNKKNDFYYFIAASVNNVRLIDNVEV